MVVFDKRAASVISTILLFIAAGAFIYLAARILIVFLLAILFAYLLEPVVSRLQLWNWISRCSRSLAILEVYLLLGGVVSIVVWLAGPPIMQEGKNFVQALPALMEKLNSGQIALQIGSRRGWSYSTQVRLQEFLAVHSSQISNWVSSAATRAAEAARNLIWIVLIPILSIFFLKDGRIFIEEILDIVERGRQKRFLTAITNDLNEMLAHYIRSQIILAGLSLLFYVAALSLLRVPYALALGSVAGIMEFVPVVGPLVGATAILGVSFLSNYHHLLLVVFFLGSWRVVQDYFTTPRIMGGRLELHPLAVIFAVLVGGEIGGVIGIYLSIPIVATLRIVWRRWRRVYAEEHANVRAA